MTQILICRQQVLTMGGTNKEMSSGLKQCFGKLFLNYGDTKFLCDLGKQAIADDVDFYCDNRKFESKEKYMVMGKSRSEKVAFLVEAEQFLLSF